MFGFIPILQTRSYIGASVTTMISESSLFCPALTAAHDVKVEQTRVFYVIPYVTQLYLTDPSIKNAIEIQININLSI